MLRRRFVGANGGVELTDRRSAFAWYELVTTDAAAAREFYGRVVGWRAKDASAAFPYTVFAAGETEVGGLMQLPPDAVRKGAMPRWVGYVAVDDIDARVERLKQLGGSVFVPPTDSNIGRVSIVADPQTADFGMVSGLTRRVTAAERPGPGEVGWHELFAADGKSAFDFYGELFGWQAAQPEKDLLDTYQLISSGGRTFGGVFTKLPRAPVFWMYYFEVDDMAVAVARVREGGGRVVQGPMELLGGSWIARCMDPQGTMFSLEGKSSQTGIEPAKELSWAADWGGFTSRGKVVAKPKR
jgi:uncharacterized protein